MERLELMEKLEAKLCEELESSLDEMLKVNKISHDYGEIIRNMESLFYFSRNVKDEIERIKNPVEVYGAQFIPAQEMPTTVTVESPTEKAEEPKEESFRTPEPEPVGDGRGVAVLEEPKELTYEDVRAAVKAKAASGVPMQPVIEKFVPNGKPVKLSSVPKTKWAELMKELEDAE